jgi:hypothetical protein
MEGEGGLDIKTMVPIITGGISLLILGMAIAIPLALSTQIINREPNTPLERQASNGCYLKDEAFAATNAVVSGADAESRLKAKYSKVSGQSAELDKIITASVASGVNPAILMAFWAGEQGYNKESNYKAFGCGAFHPGDKDSGFEKQIECSIKTIKKATANGNIGEGVYTTPKNTNTWTRLLYHYVAAQVKADYDRAGYVTNSENPRIVALSLLVPDQVMCNSTSNVGQVDGKYDKFADPSWKNNIQQNWLGTSTVKGTMQVSGVVLHWTGGSNVAGAVSAMTNRSTYVHLIIDKDGTVYQLLPLNTRVASGSGDGNSFAVGIEIVGADTASLNAHKSQNNATIENLLMSNTAQKESVIKAVQYIISTYKIDNVRGDANTLTAHKGVFGHLQVQGPWKDGSVKGCKSVMKSDPGINYMNQIWGALGSTPSDMSKWGCRNIYPNL